MARYYEQNGTILNGREPFCMPLPALYTRAFASLLAIFILVSANPAMGADKFKKFKLKDLQGETVKLEDFEGKATLIAFFFPTCTYCNQAFPETVKIYEKYRDQGLNMVWINLVDEEEELIPEWLAENKYDVTVLVGASQQYLANRYDLLYTPTHIIVDMDRNILFKKDGYHKGDQEEMETRVKQALSL